jgi:hypothetical protein
MPDRLCSSPWSCWEASRAAPSGGTHNDVYSGETSVRGLEYKVPPLQFNGSLHVGWEWSF